MPDQESKPGRRYWFIVARGMLRFVAILIAMFALAGRMDYRQAWGYGGTSLFVGLVVAVLFARKTRYRLLPGVW